MSQHSLHSEACCSVPPVVSKGYEPKGKYITIDGMKTYTTGPATAKQAILIVYDIFGFFPQTLQGADILAHSDKEHQYQVFVPDFFDGKPADISWYPPDTKEKGEKLGEFFGNQAAPPKTVARVPKVVKEIESKHEGISGWGILGFCWGGKIVSLSTKEGTPFKAAASSSPAMVDPNDASSITVPTAMLASKDEDVNAVKAFEKNLKVKSLIQTYSDQQHGFMSARGNLEDAGVKKQYEVGYTTLLNWFHEHL